MLSIFLRSHSKTDPPLFLFCIRKNKKSTRKRLLKKAHAFYLLESEKKGLYCNPLPNGRPPTSANRWPASANPCSYLFKGFFFQRVLFSKGVLGKGCASSMLGYAAHRVQSFLFLFCIRKNKKSTRKRAKKKALFCIKIFFIKVMGVEGLEPSTLRLSGVYSKPLSYMPL